MLKTLTIKGWSKKLSSKIDEAFVHADKAFDAATEAFDTILDGTESFQNEHMNIKASDKSVVINGDVSEITLNGTSIFKKADK